MKKLLLTLLASGTLFGSLAHAIDFSNSNPMVSAQMKFESEYIFRGIKKGGTTFNPEVVVGLWGLNFAMDAIQPIERSEDNNQLNFDLGWKTEFSEYALIHLGGTYRMYPDSDKQRNREIYLGTELRLGTDGFWADLYPRAYIMYDFDRQNGTFTAVTSVVYEIFLSDNTSSIRIEPFLGWGRPDQGKDWFFYGARADLIYPLISNNVFATIGVRYTGKDRTGGFLGTNTNNIYWGASLRFDF